MTNHKKKWCLILLVNLLSIVGVTAYVLFSIHHLPRYNYSIDDWKSEYAEYRNNGFSVNDTIKDSGKSTEFLWGPYKPLKKGSYTANIKYTADEDQSCLATASGEPAQLFISSEGILSKHQHSVSYQFETVDNMDEFQLVIRYEGRGDFTIQSISISANNNQQKRTAVTLIFIILLIDLALLLWERNEEEKKTLLALLGITVLISLPLWIKGIHNGYDLGIHYLRIEAIVQALRSGQFPARISSITLYGLGYPFSIYYNDIFLYFPAILRLLGFSVTAAYKIYVFFINLMTVIIAFLSFMELFKDRKMGLLLTLLYTTASYRLVNVYTRAAVGEYTAQAFLPLMALAVYRIFNEKTVNIRMAFTNAFLLTVAISGIIGSHMLTTIMVGFVLILVCICLLKRTLRKQTLLTFLLTVILSFLINLYFLVPFADYYFHVPTRIKEIVSHEILLIQDQGIYPAQLFAFSQNVMGGESNAVSERMQLTPGPALMILFVYAVISRFLEKTKHSFDFLLGFSCLMLFISTNIFPWDWLTIHFSPWRVLTQIQYPCRFLVLAILFLTLLSGNLLKNKKIKLILPTITVITVITTIWFASNSLNSSKILNIYDTSGVDPYWTGPEYLLTGSSRENITTDVYSENMAAAEVLSRNSDTMQLYCKTDSSENKHLLNVPLYAYKGYRITDNNGNEYEYYPGNENRINFILPNGFDGTLAIHFQDPYYWRLALWISLGSTILSIVAAFISIHKNTRGLKCS